MSAPLHAGIAKVMFSQVSVCPQGGSAPLHAGIPPGQTPPSGQTPPCAVHAGIRSTMRTHYTTAYNNIKGTK